MANHPHGTSSHRPDLATIERAIRDYLAAHPHAADTADGVSAWWLGDVAGTCATDGVRLVLDRLVAAGAVEARTLRDGSVVYGAARTGGARDRSG